MFAVGECVICNTPLCGTHSRERGGRVLCERDATAEETAAAEAAVARAAAVEQRLLDRLGAIGDPIERLLSAVRSGTVSRRLDALEVAGSPALSRVCPQVQAGDGLYLDTQADWDSSMVARWFARRALASGLHPTTTCPMYTDIKRRFGATRTVKTLEPAWGFPKGSTVVVRESFSTGGGRATAFVLHDGRLNALGNGAGIRAGVLYVMAELLHLVDADDPPMPKWVLGAFVR